MPICIWSENERALIDKFSDEPRGTNAVDFRARPGQPYAPLKAFYVEFAAGLAARLGQARGALKEQLHVMRGGAINS